jgi:hypothetical protein
MSTIATRLEKIEAQTNDTVQFTRIIGDAIRQIIMENTDASAALRTARDQLATVASPYDVSAQYWLNAAAVMLGEVEPPRLTIDADARRV